MSMAAQIGSDVSSFITQGPVEVSGVGEVVKAIDKEFSLDGVVLKPPVSVSTRDAYGWLERDSTPVERPPAVDFENDFQSVVCERVPQVGETAKFLAGYDFIMCGSGSSFFTWKVANLDTSGLEEKGWFVERCKTL